jgi:hypothetical protein
MHRATTGSKSTVGFDLPAAKAAAAAGPGPTIVSPAHTFSESPSVGDFDESALLADTARFSEISRSAGPVSHTLGGGGAAGGSRAALLRDKDLEATPRVKAIIKNLNEKINKLYNWHLVEIDLVSRQQMQLNEMKSEINTTKATVASVSSIVQTPHPLHAPLSWSHSGLLNTTDVVPLTPSTPAPTGPKHWSQYDKDGNGILDKVFAI